jgi:hypothetical protein
VTTGTLPRGAAAEAAEESAAIAELRAGYELLAAAYRETTRRYELLRAAAHAAVIESRTSRRNPIPLGEALALLDEAPAADARLRDLPLSTAAAWPHGNEGAS